MNVNSPRVLFIFFLTTDLIFFTKKKNLIFFYIIKIDLIFFNNFFFLNPQTTNLIFTNQTSSFLTFQKKSNFYKSNLLFLTSQTADLIYLFFIFDKISFLTLYKQQV